MRPPNYNVPLLFLNFACWAGCAWHPGPESIKQTGGDVLLKHSFTHTNYRSRNQGRGKQQYAFEQSGMPEGFATNAAPKHWTHRESMQYRGGGGGEFRKGTVSWGKFRFSVRCRNFPCENLCAIWGTSCCAHPLWRRQPGIVALLSAVTLFVNVWTRGTPTLITPFPQLSASFSTDHPTVVADLSWCCSKLGPTKVSHN